MTRKLAHAWLLLILLSGCATVSDGPRPSDKEVVPQPAPTSTPPAPAQEKRGQPLVSKSVPDGSAESGYAASSVNKNLRKAQVQLVQDMLKASGFYAGPIDGIFGPKTRRGLQKYQSGCTTLEEFLARAGKNDGRLAGADGNLNRTKVRLVQIRLKAAGFDPGTLDGILGPHTRSALENYQSSRGLSNSGALDDKTLASLETR